MKNLNTKFIASMIIALCASLGVFAQASKTESDKNKYQRLEIVKFDVKEGVEGLADSSLDVMMFEIVDQIATKKKFKEVRVAAVRPTAEIPTAASETELPKTVTEPVPADLTLRMTGTVTVYTEGNRTARYLIGFGAGRAKIKAHIKVVDSNDTVLLERDIDGHLITGAFGGNASAITRGLAKEAAKVTIGRFF